MYTDGGFTFVKSPFCLEWHSTHSIEIMMGSLKTKRASERDRERYVQQFMLSKSIKSLAVFTRVYLRKYRVNFRERHVPSPPKIQATTDHPQTTHRPHGPQNICEGEQHPTHSPHSNNCLSRSFASVFFSFSVV